jgi:hypothetical protein
MDMPEIRAIRDKSEKKVLKEKYGDEGLFMQELVHEVAAICDWVSIGLL